MSNCCEKQREPSCHGESSSKPDWLLRISLSAVVLLYAVDWFFSVDRADLVWLSVLSSSVFEIINTMWWGLLLAALFVGVLEKIPQSWVLSILGRGDRLSGVLRATFAGVLLDLCSHGILMVGMKLYQRGASLGQVMAFLIASPWNSLSLTLILWALIGWQWTLLFVALSMLVGIVSGCVINHWVATGRLPENPSKLDCVPPSSQGFWRVVAGGDWSPRGIGRVLWGGLQGSKMVLRWVFLGVLLASLIRAFVPLELFQNWFGVSTLGLLMTLLAATVIEVCSEGSTPIAADLFNRASAPGNSFVFLMAGVSTDYTEIMSIKDTTGSWKLALVLPLVTLPQILLLGFVLNQWSLSL